MSRKRSILFIGDAVSLAHIARPLFLAKAIDAEQYNVHFACAKRYQSLVGYDSRIRYWPINSVPSQPFIDAANRGESYFTEQHIESYVAEEMELLDEIRPSLIIQDLRPSITVSAERRSIAYATLANIFWSPYLLDKFDWVSFGLFEERNVVQKALALKGRIIDKLGFLKGRVKDEPINVVRKKHGLAPFSRPGEMYTFGRYTLYADPPGIVETLPLPDNHLVLGPILWSPDVSLPSWWQRWDQGLPLVYVTLGSTGATKWLSDIVTILTKLNTVVIVATAGRVQLRAKGENVHIAQYLPGVEACKLASMVICNGGSATAYQALSQGKPVIGVWSNNDQYRTMEVIESAGAGLGCRASTFDPRTFQRAVLALLQNPTYTQKAIKMRERFGSLDTKQRFREFVRSVPSMAQLG